MQLFGNMDINFIKSFYIKDKRIKLKRNIIVDHNDNDKKCYEGSIYPLSMKMLQASVVDIKDDDPDASGFENVECDSDENEVYDSDVSSDAVTVTAVHHVFKKSNPNMIRNEEMNIIIKEFAKFHGRIGHMISISNLEKNLPYIIARYMKGTKFEIPVIESDRRMNVETVTEQEGKFKFIKNLSFNTHSFILF